MRTVVPAHFPQTLTTPRTTGWTWCLTPARIDETGRTAILGCPPGAEPDVYVAPGFLPFCGSPDDLCREARHLSSSWHSHSVPSGTAILGCAPLPLFSLAGHDFSRAEEFDESSGLQPRVLHLSSLWNSHSVPSGTAILGCLSASS